MKRGFIPAEDDAMTAKDVIRNLFKFNDHIMNDYLKDLSDADLFIRPAPGANHIAWQLGHLIKSEAGLNQLIPGTTPFEMPAGFAEKYTADSSKSESTDGYLTKAEYLDLFQKVRSYSLKNLEAFPDADLDKATEGRMATLVPTLGGVFTIIGNHPMMHLGQFAVVRRKLSKPIAL